MSDDMKQARLTARAIQNAKSRSALSQLGFIVLAVVVILTLASVVMK